MRPMSHDDEIAAYEGSRSRITSLVSSLDAAALATTVQCCPKWSVKDLVGHLTGLLEDRGAGRLPTGGFEGWTDAQVARHRDEPIEAVLGTWSSLPLERTDAPPSLTSLSFDAVTHEHDLFQALGIPVDPGTESVQVGARRATERLSSVLSADDAPRVVIRADGDERTVGGGGPKLRVDLARFDLIRLVTGRMSERQARALSWDGDPGPVLDALFADGFFSLQPTDVIEAADR